MLSECVYYKIMNFTFGNKIFYLINAFKWISSQNLVANIWIMPKNCKLSFEDIFAILEMSTKKKNWTDLDWRKLISFLRYSKLDVWFDFGFWPRVFLFSRLNVVKDQKNRSNGFKKEIERFRFDSFIKKKTYQFWRSNGESFPEVSSFKWIYFQQNR